MAKKDEPPRIWYDGKEITSFTSIRLIGIDGRFIYKWDKPKLSAPGVEWPYLPNPKGLRKPVPAKDVWCDKCQCWWPPDSMHAAGIYDGR